MTEHGLPGHSIRFPQGGFAALRARLLADAPREAFAVMLGKRETVGGCNIVKVLDTRHPRRGDYVDRGGTHLRLRKDYIHALLCEMTERLDVDTLIDVHTHPFSSSGVAFSSVDDADERRFLQFLDANFDGIHYASIVLSRSDYAARLWTMQDGRPTPFGTRLKTQTSLEAWPSATETAADNDTLATAIDAERGFLARSVLALGVDTLRRIVQTQTLAVIGVGGLGSQIAENLIHMGFHDLHLIDPNVLETTNLNRIVGAGHRDALERRPKVAVVRDHLTRINPAARVSAHAADIHEPQLEPLLADADWLIVATDNHASRFHAQQIAARYFVPLLSVGVNITVADGSIRDMSGEIITVRAGDRLCLNCLGRLDPARIAAERHPSTAVREGLVSRGYVSGQAVKQPAVKTLNAVLSALAVDTLVNQYTGRQPHVPVLVYESNRAPAIYADRSSISARRKQCFTCGH